MIQNNSFVTSRLGISEGWNDIVVTKFSFENIAPNHHDAYNEKKVKVHLLSNWNHNIYYGSKC